MDYTIDITTAMMKSRNDSGVMNGINLATPLRWQVRFIIYGVIHKNRGTGDRLRRLHFEYSRYDRQRSFHAAVESSHGCLLPWFGPRRASAFHLQSSPHPLNRVRACVRLLFEDGYYFFRRVPGAASIRINTVYSIVKPPEHQFLRGLFGNNAPSLIS